jgi:hypothetical protein
MKISLGFFLLLLVPVIFLISSCTKDNSTDAPIIEVYAPINPETIQKDTPIKPISATASENQPGEDIQKALDGDLNTLYHSLWDQSQFPNTPVIIEFKFGSSVERIDYLLYHPRKDGGVNGFFLEVEVWTKIRSQVNYEKYSDMVFPATSTSKRILFTNGFLNPSSIKLVVKKGYNDFASAAEFEFYKTSTSNEDYLSYFTDLSLSELKEGVTRNQLAGISNAFIRNMALALFDEAYEPGRIGSYQTYPDPSMISKQNKTNRMGSYDNITGIYVKKNEELVVFVNETKADLILRIVDHNQGYGGSDFYLLPGSNRITSPADGLIYLIYHANISHETKVNFASGVINGYFDIDKHTSADWNTLINGATYNFFDLKGHKAHLTFTKNELKRYVTNATLLVQAYDSIVKLEQDFMGLYKYNRVPATRMYFHCNVQPGVYMHATSDATEYAPGTLSDLANHSRLMGEGIWGPAHEVGHLLQTRPGLMWVGMTEVSNNIYSLYVQTAFGNQSRLQTEVVDEYSNRYQKAFKEIVEAGIAHAAHDDVFCKLVPFWQLQLYFSKVKNYKDFYKDVFEQIRQKPDPETDGECQLQFVKIVCDVSGEDLTEFFEAWGFLKPIDMEIDDYDTRRLQITQQEVDEVKAYIAGKGYPKPNRQVQYLTDETVK